MFTGLVADLGEVKDIEHTGDGGAPDGHRAGSRLRSRLGDSIAVNGVCLTATAVEGARSRPRS